MRRAPPILFREDPARNMLTVMIFQEGITAQIVGDWNSVAEVHLDLDK